MKILFFILLFLNTILAYTEENKKIITIDPGHGTKHSREGVEGEKKYAMLISKLIKEKLEKEGITVFLSHQKYDGSENLGENPTEDNKYRAEFSNNKNSDIYLRIHFDAKNGFSAIYYPEKHKDKEVAQKSGEIANILFKHLNNILKETGEKYSNKVLTDGDTYVGSQNNGLLIGSRYSKRPSVLLEVLPMTENAKKWIEKKENQEKYSDAVKNGILEYLNK